MISSPWGEIAVSDAHVHFFSHRFFSLLTSSPIEEAGQRLGWTMPPDDPALLARHWVDDLDRHGVARAALIASIPGDEGSVGAAVQAFPDRFFGYFLVNPMVPDAVARAEAAFAASHFRAVCLFPAMHAYPIAGEEAGRVIAVAAAHRAAVFVHCGVLSVGVRRRLGLPSRFDMRYSNPIDLHPVALAHPDVDFLVPHFGAGYFREALMLGGLCPNVYLDTSSSNHWMDYQERPLTLRDVFDRALHVYGAGRLLFGTDSSFFPRGWHAAIFEAQAKALYELGMSEEDAGRIFSSNLCRVLESPRALSLQSA